MAMIHKALAEKTGLVTNKVDDETNGKTSRESITRENVTYFF